MNFRSHIALCTLVASFAFSQLRVGSIRGTVRDAQTPVERDLRVQLRELSSGSVLQHVQPARDGSFIFRNIPFGAYEVTVFLDSVQLAERTATVASPAPVVLLIDRLREYQTADVVITAAPLQSQAHASPHTLLSSSSIEKLFAAGSTKRIEHALLSVPGMVPDEDGRLHARGEDAQLQYVVDGIPITSNLTRVYASLFNASTIKSIDIQTGALNAEYGVATSGVLAITTKSGFEKPLFANASANFGSFGSADRSLQLGGTLGSQAAFYIAGTSSESDRYLDPISGFTPIHDHGSATNLFAKFNYVPTERYEVVVLGGMNNSAFEIPNSRSNSLNRAFVPPQDQRQNMSDHTLGVRLNILLGESSFLSVVGYTRSARAATTSGGLKRIVTTADTAQAIRENEKFFIGAERSNDVTGGQIQFSTSGDWYGLQHGITAGVSAESYPLKEFFTFAVTNPNLSDAAVPGGDARYLPYDLTKGGRPFLVDQQKTGMRIGAFLQDQLSWGAWMVNAGVRVDQFSLFTDELSVSPRVNAAYAYNDQLILRGSYNRIVMQAPVENVLVSSSSEARLLTGAQQGATPTTIRSEKEHVVELGGFYRLNEWMDFDLAGYGKFIEDFIVKVELGNSGIIFPVNLKNGLVAGGELKARLHDWNRLSGEFTLSTTASLGLKPEDGSSPFAAGLILGEEGYFYTHPFAGEEMFPTEHNQLITATLRANYALTEEFSLGLGARFDSGLPFDLADSTGKGLDESAARTELKARGYSDAVIDLLSLESEEPGSPDKSVAPHIVFDLGIDYRFTAFTLPLRASLSVLNVLDTQYLYKFESSFGGTHFGVPRTIMFGVEVSY